jgi:hypothetical protein
MTTGFKYLGFITVDANFRHLLTSEPSESEKFSACCFLHFFFSLSGSESNIEMANIEENTIFTVFVKSGEQLEIFFVSSNDTVFTLKQFACQRFELPSSAIYTAKCVCTINS